MKAVLLSSAAEADLVEILDYTTDRWGARQADRYLADLHLLLSRLLTMPQMGRPCDGIHPGYRRLEYGRHVLFYQEEKRGIFVARVLHQSMLPVRDRFLDAHENPKER